MLWHLATHPDDTQRLVSEPELLPTAIEEMLRAYSPVTMARIVAEDTELQGCPMKAGDRVILNFPAANRDPNAFPDADRVLIDREINRHVAFGAGIHRCAGSNLARMELTVALEEWLARIPSFRLEDVGEVTWAAGQVRGPRRCRWCSREGEGGRREVPGPRPLLRARARTVRTRRVRHGVRRGRRHGAAGVERRYVSSRRTAPSSRSNSARLDGSALRRFGELRDHTHIGGAHRLAAVATDHHSVGDVAALVCISCRGGPSGARQRSPHCRRATTTGHRSRP